ncbi:MAG: hypothetical protein EOO38_22130 [Cytophagaceae bacterium]|nr:MAG: hypothetical protein EOO38_22130 [Cytophagaceae bacterium]
MSTSPFSAGAVVALTLPEALPSFNLPALKFLRRGMAKGSSVLYGVYRKSNAGAFYLTQRAVPLA